MKKLLLLVGLISINLFVVAATILVKNKEELSTANSNALPGDIIVLQNGNWKNITITLDCNGTKENPITFKAQTAGKVLITGNSKLKIGGSYIVIDGLYFMNGYSDRDAVIAFRMNKDHIANNCRVTNTVINDFNNAKRLDENYWVSFYGKKNRLDHCSFLNKKNLGVLLAVILDDERNRENFHLIDHNYFGVRLPLASNAGEIIRVGVAEHSHFNSNTQITDNYFEHCDGEAEIISIKSCQNIVRNNVFKECQGSVVLRHGNYNTVENNVFLGNNKEGTGGVRVINKGQWIVNNFFYKCRGEGFRSPLSIMNGVPNSPAIRYVEVSEAVICNNSFYECSTINFCEGSDAERTVRPHDVSFLNNILYNTMDSKLYNIYDSINGIGFTGNLTNRVINQQLINGLTKTSFVTQSKRNVTIPVAKAYPSGFIPDSIAILGRTRTLSGISSTPGYSNLKQFEATIANAFNNCGAKWFSATTNTLFKKQIIVTCRTADEVLRQLELNINSSLTIKLTGNEYIFNSPVNISGNVLLTSTNIQAIKFSQSIAGSDFFIQLKAGGSLQFNNLNLNLESIVPQRFITTDTSGRSGHSNFSMTNCTIKKYKGIFFNASRSSVLDSVIITNCSFSDGNGDVFKFTEETGNKGYYNVEKLKINSNVFSNCNGQVLAMLRSGKDESTMGPLLIFSGNKINNCFTENDDALIYNYGTQSSLIEKNSFINSNTNKTLVFYEDAVRAAHIFRKNIITNSGKVSVNKFTESMNNTIE